MIIITMERRTLDGKPVIYDTLNECAGEYRDWWCVIETKEEEMVYEAFLRERNSNIQSEQIMNLWNDMVKQAGLGEGVSWGDDDIYGYIRPDEMPPEVGMEYIDSDNDKWIRVE